MKGYLLPSNLPSHTRSNLPHPVPTFPENNTIQYKENKIIVILKRMNNKNKYNGTYFGMFFFRPTANVQELQKTLQIPAFK